MKNNISFKMILIGLLTSSSITYAQAPATPFEKAYNSTNGTYGMNGHSIVQTVQENVTGVYSGGFVIGGKWGPLGTGAEHAKLVRIDKGGNMIWDRTYMDPIYQCNSEAMCVIAKYPYDVDSNKTDQGYVFTGYYQGVYNQTSAEAQQKRLIMWGVDAAGVTTWTRAFTRSNNTEIVNGVEVDYRYNAYGQHIANIGFNTPVYIAVGYLEKIRVSDSAIVDHQIIVAYFDQANAIEKCWVYDTGTYGAGLNYFDKAYCVVPAKPTSNDTLSQDAVITVTRNKALTDTDPQTVLFKIDLSSTGFGTVLWSKQYTLTNGLYPPLLHKAVHTERVVGPGLSPDEVAGYVTTGYTQYIPNGTKNVLVLKTDLNGNGVWARSIDPLGLLDDDEGFSVKEQLGQSGEGQVLLVAGYTYNEEDKQAMMLELDLDGATHAWPGYHSGTTSDEVFEDLVISRVIVNSGDRIVCAGTTDGYPSAVDDFYAVRLDKNSNNRDPFNDPRICTPIVLEPVNEEPGVQTSTVNINGGELENVVRTVHDDVDDNDEWTEVIDCRDSDGSPRMGANTKTPTANVQEAKENVITIMPNPVTEKNCVITLTMGGKAWVEGSIYNILGETVSEPIQSMLEAGQHTFKVPSSLQPGSYIFKVLIAGRSHTINFTVVK